jgi:glycosyltransferase involved in cell wall biosynthesis
MSRLSQHYYILFVDPPSQIAKSEFDRPSFQQTHSAPRRIITISPSLKVLSPCQIQSDSNLYSPLIADQIKKALASLRWNNPPLVWIYNLPAVSLVGQLRETGVVYDCVDSFASFSWAHPDTHLWEKELLCKAQVVLTSARALFEKRRKINILTYLVPNAADYEHFARNELSGAGEPADLRPIGHPRLGFIGAAYEWLDYDLLKYLATNNPGWNLIMIGPHQHGINLPERENIHWLGARDYKTLPWYLANIDVMLIPFARNQTTEHANPIKLWEYLAAGKPVVSTRLPEVREVLDLVWLSDNHREFQMNCEAALDLLKNPEKREDMVRRARIIARSNSWEVRCKEIRDILQARFGM